MWSLPPSLVIRLFFRFHSCTECILLAFSLLSLVSHSPTSVPFPSKPLSHIHAFCFFAFICDLWVSPGPPVWPWIWEYALEYGRLTSRSHWKQWLLSPRICQVPVVQQWGAEPPRAPSPTCGWLLTRPGLCWPSAGTYSFSGFAIAMAVPCPEGSILHRSPFLLAFTFFPTLLCSLSLP